MLKNKGNVISKQGITGKPKCYVLSMAGCSGMMFSLAIDEDAANELFDVADRHGRRANGRPQAFGPMAAQVDTSERSTE